MKVTHYLDIDLSRRLPIPQVAVMQGDENTRTVTVALYDNGIAWEPPADVTVSLAFEKPDKTSGWYDTLPTGETAAVISGNEVTITLAPEVLTDSGVVHASVVFRDAAASQLATFPFRIWVEKNPTAKNSISNSYYRYSSLAEINDAMGSTAPGIALQAAGTSIAVTDAAAKNLQALRVFGKTTQAGTPAPTAQASMVSLRQGGSIAVSIAQTGQTVTVPTPNGLHGVPVYHKDSAYAVNYTDASGQKWICDEIDLARGVYIQRLFSITLDGSETWVTAANGDFLLGALYYDALYDFGYDTNFNDAFHLCSHFRAVGYYQAADGTVVSSGTSVGIGLKFKHSGCADLDSWKAYLAAQAAAGTPVTLLLRKKTPVETPLSATLLHPYTQNVTVSNDAGAAMELSYIADTKAYIDQKLAAISAAMLNN